MAKKVILSIHEFEGKRGEFEMKLRNAIESELADCELPDLADDPNSGALWGGLPTVDSKTAHKVTASVVEEHLGCDFDPAWIQRGGYESVDEVVAHVVSQVIDKIVDKPMKVKNARSVQVANA